MQLLQDEFAGNQEKVPGVSDIPIFGNLFKSESRSRKKTNLMVFLRPVVLRDAASTQQFSADRYDQMLSRVAEPISPQYIQGWKKKMALQDIKIAEYLCDDIGKKFGYERATTLSLGEKIQFAVRFVWVWLLTKIYLFYFKSYYRLPFAYRFRKYKHTEPIPSYS